MTYLNRIISSQLLPCCLFMTAVFFNTPVLAQVVDDVLVTTNSQGYEIEVKFFVPIRYQSHSPKQSGKTLEIQLRSESFSSSEAEYRNLSWDKSSGLPVQEIIFDGQLVEAPSLIVRFTKKVKFNVRSNVDLRSIIISVEAPQLAQAATVEAKPKSQPKPAVGSGNLVTVLKKTDPKLADVLDRANNAMLDKNYSKAVQLFTKIRDESSGELRKHVQELLGVAREYNDQLAHAKAEYQKYLEDYPDGEDAARVNQRLTALITAPESPKAKLKLGRRGKAKNGSEWDTQFYGSFSQTYFRDEITPEDQESELTRSDLTNDLDFVARARKGDRDIRTQFIGSYREDMRSDGEGGEFLPSIMSIEARDSGVGMYARLGRQSRTTGGVLGRFDGVHAAYEMSEMFTLNTVFGYPVDTTDRTKINTDQPFYGVSVDVATLWDGWDFNGFYITQDNSGIKDREAVGGEVRYFDPTKSLFTLLDYDIAYSDLNIFLLIGNWRVLDNTSLNLVLDYRNSPILTTTNAIQGQGVEELEHLFGLYSEEELNDLAIDRTADSKSITAGVTQNLNEQWQVTGEVTVTEFGETEFSGGVEAIPSTGKEYFYSTQLIANSLFYENDIMIMGARYLDSFNSDTYSTSLNWRINVDRKLRLNPRMRLDYREDKDSEDNRWLFRPFLRVDYRFKKWMKFEFDLGFEWLEESFGGEVQKTTGYFLSIGYRAQF